MKYMRKIFALVLAVIMVMSLATTAFADETTYTLTLNNAQEGHTYSAYQIFAGDLDGTTLSNIVWGSGVSAEGQTELGSAADKAASLKTTEEAEAFAAEVAPYLATVAGSAIVGEGANTCEITGLKAGYYLVQTTATPDENGVKTYYIMKVVADTSASIKADVPEVEKTVNDDDANIGDTVTFTLTATMPSNLQGYETYKVVFHDTLSAGLAYKEIKSVVVDGNTLNAEDYTVSHEDGKLTITIDDVLDLGAAESSTIVVEYTATVDSDAVIGTEGNLNKVYLEYSNDPNWDGEGTEPTGDTPDSEVKVYTWEIPVFKYTEGEDDAKNPLADAGFTLYKGETAINLVAAGTNAEGVPVYKVCTLTGCEHEHETEIVTDDNGKFEIEGLEKGTYTLKETTTPAGYNTCADITVTIGDNGALTQNGTAAVSQVEVLNQAGSTLPSTGGMGTTLFYVFGAILMVGAAVLLVTKRRMNMAE